MFKKISVKNVGKKYSTASLKMIERLISVGIRSIGHEKRESVLNYKLDTIPLFF